MAYEIYEPVKRVNTPWGLSDDAGFELAEGIIVHATPSHGGIFLSQERVKEFDKVFPVFERTTGDPQWFEEDCDAVIIPLAFPHLFSAKDVRSAALYLASMCKAGFERFYPVHERMLSNASQANRQGS